MIEVGDLCLYILHKEEIWSGVTDAYTDSQTLKDKATQLLIKCKSGALVTQFLIVTIRLIRNEQRMNEKRLTIKTIDDYY